MNSPFQPLVPEAQSRRAVIVSWMLQILVATILFQTLFFKFTASEESVYIFKKLDMEPGGRIFCGVAELIACILLLVPRTVIWGALVTSAVISGAIVSHLTKLGVVVRNDGGLLFGLAVITWNASAVILYLRRQEILQVIGRRRRVYSNTTGTHLAQ